MKDLKENMYKPKEVNVQKLNTYLNKSKEIKEYIETIIEQFNVLPLSSMFIDDNTKFLFKELARKFGKRAKQAAKRDYKFKGSALTNEDVQRIKRKVWISVNNLVCETNNYIQGECYDY